MYLQLMLVLYKQIHVNDCTDILNTSFVPEICINLYILSRMTSNIIAIGVEIYRIKEILCFESVHGNQKNLLIRLVLTEIYCFLDLFHF